MTGDRADGVNDAVEQIAGKRAPRRERLGGGSDGGVSSLAVVS